MLPNLVFKTVLTSIVILGLVASAAAQEDEECFFCHGEADLTKETSTGEVVHLYVDEAVYSKSMHGENGCISCHADIEELPHNEDLERVQCGMCHDEAEEYAESLHGVALVNGDTDVASCDSCHGTHDVRTVSDPLSPVNPRNLPATCGKCHSDPALVRDHMISVRAPSVSYLKSTHAQAIREGRNLDAASCNDCHGTHDLRPSHDPNSKVYRLNIPSTCGKCHADVVEEYSKSIHGRALEAGIKDAPTCIDCHGEHDIESSEQDSSAVSRQQVVRSTCPRCHDNERIMTRYGVETMRQASYMDSYHGMASAAGSEIVAGCTSCHGIHSILSHSNPESSTHLDNLPATCGKCHENAGPNFAIGAVHIVPTDPGQKALGFVRLAYIGLIVLVIGGMVGHNTLMMARHATRKFRQELRGPNTYQRFNSGQTIGHLVLTISFIVLAVSGFALRYPETWWAQLLFPGEAGFTARSVVHRGSALVLVGLAFVNGYYLLFTRGGRQEFWALTMKWKDIKDIFRNLGYVVGLVKEEPRFDRYSYIEKAEYWGMWWGTLLMIVTGFCMMFVNTFLAYLPKVALDVVALIHFYEAWLAVLTITVWHLYYMILDPETYPMNWSWITGHITDEDFKQRHPLEYERVTGRKARDESDPVDPATPDAGSEEEN